MAIAFSLQPLNATNAIILDKCRFFLEKRHDFDDFPCIANRFQHILYFAFCDTCILNYISIRYWYRSGGLLRPGWNSRSFPLFHQHAPWRRQRKGSAARWIGIQSSPDDSAVKCTMKPQQKLGGHLGLKIFGYLWSFITKDCGMAVMNIAVSHRLRGVSQGVSGVPWWKCFSKVEGWQKHPPGGKGGYVTQCGVTETIKQKQQIVQSLVLWICRPNIYLTEVIISSRRTWWFHLHLYCCAWTRPVFLQLVSFFFIPTKRRDRRVPSPWPWPLCRVPLAALWRRRGQRGCQHRSRNGMFMEAVAGQQEGGKFQILDDKLLKTEGGFLSDHFPHLWLWKKGHLDGSWSCLKWRITVLVDHCAIIYSLQNNAWKTVLSIKTWSLFWGDGRPFSGGGIPFVGEWKLHPWNLT